MGRRAPDTSEEESSDTGDDRLKRRARNKEIQKRRPKTRNRDESEQERSSRGEESSESQEDSSDRGSPPPRGKKSNRRSRETDSEDQEDSNNHESPPRRQKAPDRGSKQANKESRRHLSNEQSPPHQPRTANRRSRDIPGKDQSESDASDVDPAPRRRQKPSPSRASSRRPRSRGYAESTRSPKSREERRADPKTARPKPRIDVERSKRRTSGLANTPMSPPPDYLDGPNDQIAKALEASKHEARNKPKRSEWVDDEEGTRQMMAASKREAKKTPQPEKFVDDTEELAKIMAVSKREAKNAPKRERFVDDAEELAKALAVSKRETNQGGQTEEFVDDDEELRRVLEQSQLEGQNPVAGEDSIDDEDLNKILEASKQDAAAHEARLQEAWEGKKREKEITNESKLAAEEDNKKRKERETLAEEDFRKQQAEAVAANLDELKLKKIQRQKALEWENKRKKEIAEEERKRIAAEREQERSARRAGNGRGGRVVQRFRDDDAPIFLAQLAQVQAESLGDQTLEAEPDIEETGLTDPPPSYRKRDPNAKKIDDPTKCTTSSRDIAQSGKCIKITDYILKEMMQYSVRMAILQVEESMDPKDPKPPAYRRTGSKKEAKALATVLKPRAPPRQGDRDRAANLVAGTVRPNLQQRYGNLLPAHARARESDEARERVRRQQVESRAALNRPFARIPRAY